MSGSGDFSIGSRHWPGVSKLIEECGEVLQVAGKLMQTGATYWDGTNLKERLEEELADLQAAIEFVACHNDLAADRIGRHVDEKIALFNKWHKEQGES